VIYLFVFQFSIFLLCKFLKTKEKRKFKHQCPKPDCNGGSELTEVVSKSSSDLTATAPADDTPDGEKKRKIKKPLPGEDFYAGKTELPHSAKHNHSDEDKDDDEKDGLENLLFGKDDDEPSTGFF